MNDGDFLVRQSSADTNQYVLSGKQNGMVKHLLLVDPEGVVCRSCYPVLPSLKTTFYNILLSTKTLLFSFHPTAYVLKLK